MLSDLKSSTALNRYTQRKNRYCSEYTHLLKKEDEQKMMRVMAVIQNKKCGSSSSTPSQKVGAPTGVQLSHPMNTVLAAYGSG